MHAYIIIVGIS